MFCLYTFPNHNLNFHWRWRWWDWTQAIFLKSFLLYLQNISKGSLDSFPSSSPSVKIQIMSGRVCLRCKGKTLLGIVNKLLNTKSLLISPSNVLPYYKCIEMFLKRFQPQNLVYWQNWSEKTCISRKVKFSFSLKAKKICVIFLIVLTSIKKMSKSHEEDYANFFGLLSKAEH